MFQFAMIIHWITSGNAKDNLTVLKYHVYFHKEMEKLGVEGAVAQVHHLDSKCQNLHNLYAINVGAQGTEETIRRGPSAPF